MGVTQLTTRQIGAGGVNRDDLDTTTSTKSVITKVIAGSNVSISYTGTDSGTGDVTINASGAGGITVTEVTGTTQALSVNNEYILNNASLVTATLPSTAAVGDKIYIVGKGAGGWKIAQNASQFIKLAYLTSITGTSGYIASNSAIDCVTLECTTTNNGWTVTASSGNISINV